MRKMLYGFITLGMLICSAQTAVAGVSIGIGLPNVSIGINLPLFPELVPVPGYPVYYAPGIDGNYFFYDGMYWVYQDDNWYASSWYNGPWAFVDPMAVPLFVLRVPVSYYRQPPVYFRGWHSNAPPRWGEHWGRSWEERRGGWDHWQRGSAPRPAPLPVYQRQYSGDRYPRAEQQHVIRSQQYRYQPRDKVVRQHFQQTEQKAPAARRGGQAGPQAGSPQQQGNQRSAPQQQVAPAGQRQQPQHRGDQKVQKSAPAQAAPQQRAPAAHEQRQQPAPAQHQRQPAASPRDQRAPQGHEQKGGGQEQKDGGQEQRGGGQEQDRGHDKGEGRGGNR